MAQRTLAEQFEEVIALQARGDYRRALEIALPLIDSTRAQCGDGEDLAEVLSTAGILCRRTGMLARAEPLYLQSLAIRRRLFGELHPAVAASLNNLATLYLAMEKPAEAEELQRHSLHIKRQVFGEAHPEVGFACSNLAATYLSQKKYAEAEPLLLTAMHNLTAGEPTPRIIETLLNLTTLYEATGRPDEALRHSVAALDQCRLLLQPGHPMTVACIRNLAGRYVATTKFANAAPLYQEAFDILRQSAGEDDDDTMTVLHNLAAAYHQLGEYGIAAPLMERVLSTTRRTKGSSHPMVASCLNSLGLLHREVGSLDRAEHFLEEALELARTLPHTERWQTALALNNLASLNRQRERYDKAEALFGEAVAIQRTLEDGTSELAQTLNNLAFLYADKGDLAAAERQYEEALTLLRQKHHGLHVEVATVLNNLAEIYRETGRHANAERYQQEANAMYEQLLGPRHPKLERGLINLAKLYAEIGRPADAFRVYLRATEIDDHVMGDVFAIGTEQQRADYMATITANLHGLLSLVLVHLPASQEAVRGALDLLLRRKAIGAETVAAQREAVLSGLHSSLAPQLRELTSLRAELAGLELAPRTQLSEDDLHVARARTKGRMEELETELARELPEMNVDERLRALGHEAIASALPAKSVLIELVRFPVHDYSATAANGKPIWMPDRYVAFVLPSGKAGDVTMLELGEADDIDRLVADFRAALPGGEGAFASKAARRESSSDGVELRRILFDPIAKVFGATTRILIAPDGDLGRLPFEVLPLQGGMRLLDTYEISYLGTGRDALRFGAAPAKEPGAPVVIADPDFDWSEPGVVVDAATHQAEDSASLSFPRLTASRVEGERIASQLGAALYVERDASESRLKSCHSPRILHIATHGYFLPNELRAAKKDKSGIRSQGITGPDDGSKVFMMLGRAGNEQFNLSLIARPGRLGLLGLQAPMLRSGLALAGANTWLRHGALPREAEDGFLTAEDLSGLDLLATELVVLSACETGLGDVQVGEGVMGLRRACVLAGAQTVVMSMWKVPDEQTLELMEEFYRRLLRGEARSSALRAAQLKVKTNHPHPIFWGAFVCQGDPGPLS